MLFFSVNFRRSCILHTFVYVLRTTVKGGLPKNNGDMPRDVWRLRAFVTVVSEDERNCGCETYAVFKDNVVVVLIYERTMTYVMQEPKAESSV